MGLADRVAELRQDGLSLSDIIHTLQEEGQQVYQKGQIFYQDKKPLPDANMVRDYIKAMMQAQAALERMDTAQSSVRIALNESKPVGLVFTGDWHVGGTGTAYDWLDRDIGLIRTTSGLYAVGMGDYKDNFLRQGTPPGQHEHLFPPGMQDAVVLYYLGLVAQKLLALVEGNHDEWTDTVADVDLVEFAARQAGAAYLGPGGMIRLVLGQVEYEIAIRHHYPGSTKLNPGGGMKKLAQDMMGCDVAVLAHLHNIYCSTERLGIGDKARDVTLIRNGSYKVFDKYGNRVGGFEGDPRMPMVILYPDSRRVDHFRDFKDGLDTLARLRA